MRLSEGDRGFDEREREAFTREIIILVRKRERGF